MTRQEAAAILKDNLYGFVGDDITEALYLAVEALEGPAPDPDTGLVPCGCGSPAVVLYNEKLKCLYVQCTRCDTRSNFFNHRENAVFMWNRAMGKQEETL